MANNISVLYGANVYMGASNTAGQTEEVTLPKISAVLMDYKPLSNLGKVDIPMGIEKMDMKIKWNQVTADLMAESADIFTGKDIMVRSNIDNWENGSRSGSVPLVAFIRATSKNTPDIGFKHQDAADVTTEYNVTAYKLEIDGEVIFDIDIYAQVYMVRGVDLMADYRANLGL